MGLSEAKVKLETKAKSVHAKVPGISKLPFRAVAIIAAVSLVNALIWVALGIVIFLSHLHPLPPPPRLSLPEITGWLTTSKQSIVIITSIVVAATAAAISAKFGTFSRVGGIIGTSVSAGVLILLGIANLYILWKLVRRLRSYLERPAQEPQLQIQGHGCMFGLLRKLFWLMDKWVSAFVVRMDD
ncbi:MAG: hypothetical protein Q9222_000583 [Ikaeria aurantiellina]